MEIDAALAGTGALFVITGIVVMCTSTEARTWDRRDRIMRWGIGITAIGLLSGLAAIWTAVFI